jgi:hypothetical protein
VSRSAPGRRCCHRSTGSSTTAPAPRNSSSSTIRCRCTGRLLRPPVLYGDQLAGQADARAGPKGGGVLAVNAVHQNVPFNATMTASGDQDLTGLAGWVTLDLRHAGGPHGPARAAERWHAVPHAGSRASDLAGENCAPCGASLTHARPPSGNHRKHRPELDILRPAASPSSAIATRAESTIRHRAGCGASHAPRPALTYGPSARSTDLRAGSVTHRPAMQRADLVDLCGCPQINLVTVTASSGLDQIIGVAEPFAALPPTSVPAAKPAAAPSTVTRCGGLRRAGPCRSSRSLLRWRGRRRQRRWLGRRGLLASWLGC